MPMAYLSSDSRLTRVAPADLCPRSLPDLNSSLLPFPFLKQTVQFATTLLQTTITTTLQCGGSSISLTQLSLPVLWRGVSWFMAQENDCGLWPWKRIRDANLGFLAFPSTRDLSIDTLQDLLTNGTTTSEDLVKTYLARIAEINPSTRSVLEVSPFALEDARKRDNERRGTGVRSKMHGIPILVKGVG